jgi:predicted  nucleic acid-binding Zn-ribbon protein
MTAESESLMLEILKRIQADIADLKDDLAMLKIRATAVDEHLSGLFISVSGNNARLDRVDERLARIERRLDLTDAHDAR